MHLQLVRWYIKREKEEKLIKRMKIIGIWQSSAILSPVLSLLETEKPMSTCLQLPMS